MGRPLCLKPRLMAVAGYVRPADRLADVGTDHARLPVYLMQRGLCRSTIALDCAPGPLERARRTLGIHGLTGCVDLRLSDGLAEVSPDEVDTVVIAGMGGDTILGIVEKVLWLREKRLITQPQTLQERFGERMTALGFELMAAEQVTEGRRRYMVYVFDNGAAMGMHTALNVHNT